MPFSGLPSRSCEACRIKKTKCSAQRPSCTQCLRMGRVCPGYRDRVSLLFRNESDKVRSRCSKKSGKRSRTTTSRVSPESPPPPSSSSVSLLTSLQSLETTATLERLRLSCPLRDTAICAFLHQYGCEESSCFNYISHVLDLGGTAGSKAMLHDTLKCLGLAYLSTASRGSLCRHSQAVEKYGKVIQVVNRALRNSATALSDHTLAAILMLALFENITGQTLSSFRWWSKHLYGATAIVTSRGEAQFRSTVGRKLFKHLRHLHVLYALQQDEAIPVDIIRLSDSFVPESACEVQDNALFSIMARFCSLNNQEYTEASEAGDLDFTAAVMEVDAAMELWIASCSCADRPLAMERDILTTANEGSQDELLAPVASSLDSLAGWSHAPASSHDLTIARSVRLLINRLILSRLSCALDGPDRLHVSAEMLWRQNIQSVLCREICASVPPSTARGSQDGGGDDLKGVTAHTFIWPLYTVAIAPPQGGISPELRQLAIDKLHDIGVRAALMQGTALARVLKTKFKLTAWPSMSWKHDGAAAGSGPLASDEVHGQGEDDQLS